jgi:hypothetical protein
MAGIVGTQDLWIVGSRFYFEQGTRGSGKMVDLGTVDVISPQITTNIAELKDGEKGIQRLLDQSITQIDEVYNITIKNFNLANLNTLFLGGGWSGSSTVVSASSSAFDTLKLSLEDINNIGGRINTTPDEVITGAGGVYLFQMTSSSENIRNFVGTGGSLTIGGVTQVEGTNWKWYDKSRGLIQIITLADSGGASGATEYSPDITFSSGRATAFATGTSIALLFTPSSATFGFGAGRVMYPQTASLGNLAGTGHVYWTRNNGEYMTARSFPCQIQPAGAALSSDDYSSWTLAVTVLANSTVAGEEAGRVVYATGTNEI